MEAAGGCLGEAVMAWWCVGGETERGAMAGMGCGERPVVVCCGHGSGLSSWWPEIGHRPDWNLMAAVAVA
jgi:hypothetical protein